MAHYITTHDQEGRSIFSDKVPSEPVELSNVTDASTTQILYTTRSLFPNVSDEHDIDLYARDRIQGLPQGSNSPPTGIAVYLLNFNSGQGSHFRRSLTLETILIMSGDAELKLDSGQCRILHAGDSVVQGATMQEWKNIVPC